MAKYIGDSKVKYNTPSHTISNGVVSPINLRDRGYSNSMDGTSGRSSITAPTNTGGSTGVAGTRRTSSSGSSSSSNLANAYSQLLAAYKQNDYSNYLDEMKAAAQNAYDRGMNALNSAYDSQLSSLSDNLNETKSQLLNQYNRSKQSITDDAANSLKQAYINRMLSQRNLGQQMSALGLNGGATESTLAGMLNNYGNARNNINTTQNNNLSNLEGNYSDNLSQAMQAYNSAVAQANLQKAQQAMSLENALANNQISALGDYQTLMQRENQNYLDLLKAAIANGASFNYNPTSANNAVNAVAVQQASNPTVTNNTAWQNLVDTLSNSNGGGVALASNTAAQANPYAYILNQLLAQKGA